MDWKKGRFNVNAETTLINRALRGWQSANGDSVNYFRFEVADSVMHPVYDEATEEGKAFYGRWELPALHVTHVESGNEEPRDSGLYITDTLQVVCSFDQLSKLGLRWLDLRHGSYQRDRIAYDNLLWAVRRVNVTGQVRRRDIVVTFEAVQIKGDELVNDPVFAPYLTDHYQHQAAPQEGEKHVDPYA